MRANFSALRVMILAADLAFALQEYLMIFSVRCSRGEWHKKDGPIRRFSQSCQPTTALRLYL